MMSPSRRKDEPIGYYYTPTSIQMRSVVKGDHFVKRRKSIWPGLTLLILGLWGLVELARAIY